NFGQIAPLDKIVELREKYKFHVLLDESNSFGVLGKSGRGLTEYCRIPVFLETRLFFLSLITIDPLPVCDFWWSDFADIITAAMGHALATEGGFCTGSARVTDHQRLSSSGAAITSIDILEENPGLITKLKKNIAILWKGMFLISYSLACSLLFFILYLDSCQRRGLHIT
ncbi:hypothetical protein DVH24_034184, partial [Malus domestica]